ncbi:hypothetical protein BGP_2130 [Beggiatoa sp. PS]|nr:hypothetical protein BGP_2130 [Beggiatoa sp. PS]
MIEIKKSPLPLKLGAFDGFLMKRAMFFTRQKPVKWVSYSNF